jgi:hypothetical protein
MRWLVVVLASLVAVVPAVGAGCASAGGARAGVEGHRQAAAGHAAYALDGVIFAGARAGQLSASREWERGGAARAVTRRDDAELRAAFARDLRAAVPLDPSAPLHLRATLTLQDTGYFEGLAAETADVTLAADVLDSDGNLVRTITLRETSSAPLQRSASRKARLQRTFTRLSHRLAAQL